MESAIQASKVHLLSADHEEEGEHTWRIPFDPSLKEVTIALSGPGPEIEVRDPLGMCSRAHLLFGSKTELGGQDETKGGHEEEGTEGRAQPIKCLPHKHENQSLNVQHPCRIPCMAATL